MHLIYQPNIERVTDFDAINVDTGLFNFSAFPDFWRATDVNKIAGLTKNNGLKSHQINNLD